MTESSMAHILDLREEEWSIETLKSGFEGIAKLCPDGLIPFTVAFEETVREPPAKKVAATKKHKLVARSSPKEEPELLGIDFACEFPQKSFASLHMHRRIPTFSFARGTLFSEDHAQHLEGYINIFKQLDESGYPDFSILEAPQHTVEAFLPERLSFDMEYNSFLMVFSKAEFQAFKQAVEAPFGGTQHEEGALGIGKTVLAYTYAAYSKINALAVKELPRGLKFMPVYFAISNALSGLSELLHGLIDEVFNSLFCTISSKEFKTILPLYRSCKKKKAVNWDDWKNVAKIFSQMRILPIIMIDNINRLISEMQDEDLSIARAFKKLYQDLSRRMPRQTILISSSNNYLVSPMKGVYYFPFSKKKAFSKAEVLLYLSIIAPEISKEKLGNLNVVTLKYSDYFITESARTSFYEVTGYNPLFMRIAIIEYCFRTLPFSQDLPLYAMFRIFELQFEEFSQSDPKNVFDSLYQILLGFPVSLLMSQYVDKRYFVLKDELSQIYEPLYPIILRYAQDIFSSQKIVPSVVLSHVNELYDITRSPDELGRILERVFYLLCHLRAAHGQEFLSAEVNGSDAYLKFPVVPIVEKFSTDFPVILKKGVYWSSASNYPLVEGFFYNGSVLIGIQVTRMPVAEHSTSNLDLGLKKRRLLKEILTFCTNRSIGFALVYAVPEKEFNLLKSKASNLNLLNCESFIQGTVQVLHQ